MRRTSYVKNLVALTALAMLATNVSAQKNCDNVLVPSVASIQRNVNTRLSWLSTVDKSKYEELKSNSGGGLDISVGDTKIGGTADFEDFKKQLETEKTTQNFTYANTDTSRYFFSSLDKDLANIWLQCMQGISGIRVYLIGTTKQFIDLQVEWYPPPQSTLAAALDVSFPYGAAVTPKQAKFPSKLDYNSVYNISIRRSSENDDFRLNINANGLAATLLVPRDRV